MVQLLRRPAYAEALAPTPEDGPVAKRLTRLAGLRIDDVFGGLALNAIERQDIIDWVARMKAAGKKPSTIRNAYYIVKMVLADAMADWLPSDPADYVRCRPTTTPVGERKWTTRICCSPPSRWPHSSRQCLGRTTSSSTWPRGAGCALPN